MKLQLFAAALLVAAAPAIASQSTQNPPAAPDKRVTIQGCVIPGQDGTYVLTQVMEIAGMDGITLPESAHGRRIVFWLKNDEEVKKRSYTMVEVKGRFGDLKESEIELKAGTHKDGGLVVEFEGPGKDVKVPNATIGAAIGTAGQVTPEANDIKTYLAEVNVESVRTLGGCR